MSNDLTPDKLILAIIESKIKERGAFPLKKHMAEAPHESIKETCHAISYVEILPVKNKHQEQCRALTLRHLRLAYYYLAKGCPEGVEDVWNKLNKRTENMEEK